MPRYIDPTPKYTDSSNEPLPNGLLYFYESGTNTQKTTYADVNQTIANPHPLVLNGDGSVPNCFYSGAAKVVLADSDDVQIWERDPVVGAESSSFGSSWDSISVYGLNEVVTFNDVLYVSIIQNNQNNNPSSVPSAWTQFDLLRRWNVNETYNSGDPVTASDFTVYISTGNGNIGNNPVGDGGVNWVASGTGSGGLFSFIDWNASVSYGEGKANIVTGSDDNYYISIEGTGNLNKDPISEPSYWSRYNLVGDYNLNQTYNIGDIVIGSDNNHYTSLQAANINNDPISSPTFWDISGLVSFYLSTKTYILGDIVSYNSALYTSLTASNTGNQPDLSSSDWALISGVNDNLLINGGFDFWQRDTSFSGITSGYTADRWLLSTSGGVLSTVARQDNTFTAALSSNAYQLLFRSQSALGTVQMQQRIESTKSMPRTGSVTLSFVVKSTVPVTLTPSLVYNYGAGGDPADFVTGTIINVTAAEQKVVATLPVIDWGTKTFGTDNGYVAVRLTGESGVAYDIIIADVKLEEGSVATPFVRAGNTLAGESAMCHRYYQALGSLNMKGEEVSTFGLFQPVALQAAMRITPSENFTPSLGSNHAITVYGSGFNAYIQLEGNGDSQGRVNFLDVTVDAEIY